MAPLPKDESVELRSTFNGERMIRLDGLPQAVAGPLAEAYIQAQSDYPTVDRNSVYLTWSLESAAATPLDNRYGMDAPLLVVSGECFATAAQHDDFLSQVQQRDREDPAAAISGAPDRSLAGYLKYLTDRAHAQTLLVEYLAAHGTRAVAGTFAPAIQAAIPEYTIKGHRQFGEEFVEHGVLVPGRRSFGALIPELFAMERNGRSNALTSSVTEMFAHRNQLANQKAREDLLLVNNARRYENESLRVPPGSSFDDADFRFARILARESERTGERFGPTLDGASIQESLKASGALVEVASDALGSR